LTKYGSTTTLQQLAWGGAKASVPDIVTAVQNQVTALINIALNRTDDYTTVPEYINQIANTVGSDILLSRTNPQNALTTPQILDMIKVLVGSYVNQAAIEDNVNWGNTHWVY
jgi:hypothetical protein